MVLLPSAHVLPRAPAFSTPVLPLNWSTVFACAVDVPSRVIAKDVTTQSVTNTPASCIQQCDAGNFTFAGVEFSNECHCGTGLVGTPAAAPVTDCNMACSGDTAESCGGALRIQIYKSPALDPGSWTLLGCFVDTSTLPALNAPVTHTTFATNLDLISQCTNHCQHIGLPFAGVENASDCQCSTGFAPGAGQAPLSDCNSTCPLPAGLGNEFCGGVQRLEVYEHNFHF